MVADTEWVPELEARERVKVLEGVAQADADGECVAQGVALVEREKDAQPLTVPDADAEPEKDTEGHKLGVLDAE